MCIDEDRTHETYMAHRRELLDPLIALNRGKIIKSTGDGLLAEFPSALAATCCALQTQKDMIERNRDVTKDRRIVFRIGLSYGKIIGESDDIYGQEVNIAARLQAIAWPGGIARSSKLGEQIWGQIQLNLEDLGPRHFRHMGPAIHTYRYREPARP